MRRSPLLVSLLALASLFACGGPGASSPRAPRGDLVAPFEAAFREEAKGDPAAATRLYLELVEHAAARPNDPWQLVVLQAALDALVWRSIPAFSEVTEDAAIVYRTSDGSLVPKEQGSRPDTAIASRLAAIYAKSEGPFAAGLVARALDEMAEHRGEATEAARWREAKGCAAQATVTGPLGWAPVTGVTEADALAAAGAKLDAAYPAPGAFGAMEAPAVVRGRGCMIDLSAVSPQPGVRDVVVDVDVPRAQTLGVALRAHGAALLRAGGQLVIERPYELGDDEAARFGTVDATAGVLRLVARVGMDEDREAVEIDAWDEKGRPLKMHAPRTGELATAKVKKTAALPYPAAKSEGERLALAAGALAAGDGRTAERAVAEDATRANAAPELALVYARAVETARDLSLVHRAERARSAYEKVLDAWPGAWEAILAHAVLAGVRRGEGDARIETLRDLDAHRARAAAAVQPWLDAFDAATSGRDRLHDRARAALARAEKGLLGTSLYVDAKRAAEERTGAERVTYDCASTAPNARDSLLCYDALRARGDLRAAETELERLRGVQGAEDLYLALSLRDALAAGDVALARRALADTLPGDLTLSGLYGVANLDPSRGTVAPETRERLRAAMTIARDAPSSFPGLLRALGDDPTTAFAGVAEGLSQQDRAHPILAAAATAILMHTERYDLDASGVAHAVLFDVRRVSGTTDVEENAQAAPPELVGRAALRVLRRRILKKDGRVLEPDPTPRAQQSHADLAQLEAGDVVEAIYEGWAVPSETGNLGVDTPDMLPDRTAVHEAQIELRVPAKVKGALWSHPLLGKATESEDHGQRVLHWTMKDVPARRIEEGTPKMDLRVAVSFATLTWGEIAQGMHEQIAALDEHDPEILRFATEAAAGAKTTRAKVDAVVVAAGKVVKEASPVVLCDIGIDRANGPQTTTARSFLADHEGSRSWLIVRALRELGILADVVVAENDPFSADPAFPPHSGRFMHPLVVARIKDDKAGGDVWIDADVSGPPLPAGRISPELRGRSALYPDGRIVALPAVGGGDERDEIDLRLSLDAKGDAKGTFTIVLRGRDAQELAEALIRTVGDERQRALRGVALAWVPFANVDDVQLSSSEGSWQVAVRATLTIPAYAAVEGSGAGRAWVLPGIDPLHIVYPRAFTSTLGATYTSQGARQNALAVSRAVQYHAHRRIELPAGASLMRAPGPFEVKTPSLEASRRIAVSPAVIEDDFVLGLPTGTVPADRYLAFVDGTHKADDAFLASTRVKPPP